jgi:hypothetical protein
VFAKPIEQLTCSDIREFCEQQRKEGKHLDYKKEFPSDKEKIAKTVAAFANTQGGCLIVGVNDGNTDVPVPPYEGIAFREGIPNFVSQLIHSHIQPVPYFLTHVCKAEENRTFVVIHVPQSTYAPHYLSNHKSIYVRTGESSNPEDLIHPELLPWLYNARQKSVELRENLFVAANNRCVNLLPAYQDEVMSSGFVSLVYPDLELFHFHKTKMLMGKIENQVSYSSFPSRSIPGGMVFFNKDDDMGVKFDFAQLVTRGQFFYRRTLQKFPDSNAVQSTFLVSELCHLLAMSQSMQRELDLWAPILIRFEVLNLSHKVIAGLGGGATVRPSDVGVMDDKIGLMITCPGGALKDNFFEIVMQASWRLLWMLGRQHATKENIAAQIIQLNIVPKGISTEEFQQKLLNAFDTSIPMVEFEFSTEVALIPPPSKLSENK